MVVPRSLAAMMVACCLQIAWPAGPATAKSRSIPTETKTPTDTESTDIDTDTGIGASDDRWTGQTGMASFYGRAHHGKRTAWGTKFDQLAMTAAHGWLPFGTKVCVTLEGTGRSVLVTVTDRIGNSRRVIDLSLSAARSLGFVNQGIARVSLAPY
jgi:rare lipoprotein A